MSPARARISVGDLGVLNETLSRNSRRSGSTATWDGSISTNAFSPKLWTNARRLLERAKFLAIFTSNLDEFFMKRIAVLRRSDAGTVELLERIRENCCRSHARRIASGNRSSPAGRATESLRHGTN